MKKHLITTIAFFILSNLFGQTSNWGWTKVATGSGADEGWGICNDNHGNIYITGNYWSSPINFGGQTLNSAGSSDFYLAKYSPTGTLLWTKSAGGTYFDYGKSVSTDSCGNVYATGYFQSAYIAFGTDTLFKPGNFAGFFIAKYDSLGNVLWAKLATGFDGNTLGNSISTDKFGYSYVTGYYTSSSLSFGSIVLSNPNQQAAIFIAKYDSNGNAIWAKSIDGNSANRGYSISVNNKGDIFSTGYYMSSTITMGSYTLTSSGSENIYVVKYDSAGNTVWAKSVGANSTNRGYGISADNFGNAYVTGIFLSPSISFGTYNLTNYSSGFLDFYIVKYDSSGNVKWAKSGGGNKDDQGFCITTDPFGNVYLTGGFVSPFISFGSSNLFAPSGSNDAMFILKYDSLGNQLCATALASGGDDVNGISADRFGNAYITSDYMVNPFIVGSDTIILTGQENIFVSKYYCGTLANIFSLDKKSGLIIFPNPFSDKTTLQTDIPFYNVTLSIYNSQGRQVKQIKNISGKTISLDRDNLHSGLYFIRLTQGDNTIATDKLILVDN